MNIRKYLKLFDDKKSPDRISLSYENAIKYDMFSVYISDPETGKSYIFESYTNNSLEVREWNEAESRFIDVVILPINTLKINSFSGVYYFQAHQLPFNSLKDIEKIRRELFKFKAKINNRRMSKRIYEYEQQRLHLTLRMDVLAIVVNKYLLQIDSKPINYVVVMHETMNLWPFLSFETREQLKKKITLYLEGLVSSGDLQKVNKYEFIPNGKALLTLEKHSIEQERFSKTAKIQNFSLLTAIFAAIAAIVSAYAAF